MIGRCVAFLLTSGAAWAQIAAPMLGWVPDGARIRPVYGIPGSAAVGPSIDASHDFAVIAVSPRQDFVLATDAVTGDALIVTGGSVTRLDGATAGADRIVMSPRGMAAALWFSSTSRVQIVSGLPGAPSVREVDASSSGGSPAALALSDDGQWLAVGSPDGVYVFGSTGATNRLPLDEPVAALAFFQQRGDLVVATATRVMSVVDVGRADISMIYNGADQPLAPVGVAVSFDNRRIVVADRAGALLTVDLTTGSAVTVDCACSPGGVFGMGGSVFRLTDPASGVMKLFDALAGQVLFSPPALEPGDRHRSARRIVTFPLATPSLPAVTIGGPATSGPAQQPAVTIALASAAPADFTGTFTLTFASSVGGDDQMIRFSNGTRTANFTIAAGSTAASFSGSPSIAVLTGTVAGTITLTATFSSAGNDVTPSPAPSHTIMTTANVPFIQTVSLVQGTGGFSVVVTGFSTTREVVSGLFHFAPATNSTVAQDDITVQLGSAFSAWYSNSASNASGSLFTLTVPFTVANGNPGSIVAVTVTLTNTRGTSNPVSPQ